MSIDELEFKNEFVITANEKELRIQFGWHYLFNKYKDDNQEFTVCIITTQRLSDGIWFGVALRSPKDYKDNFLLAKKIALRRAIHSFVIGHYRYDYWKEKKQEIWREVFEALKDA